MGEGVAEQFQTGMLPNGVRLYLQSTKKFKSNTVRAFWYEPLQKEQASHVALVSNILRRGTKSYPTTRLLAAHLEDLYGAEIVTDTIKIGLSQLGLFHYEAINDRYLGKPEDLLQKGLNTLAEVMTKPRLDGSQFYGEYVEQEKLILQRQIESMVNDKAVYAQMRCLDSMLGADPYAVYRFGSKAAIVSATPANLYELWQSILTHRRLDIYAVGDLDWHEFYDSVGRSFGYARQEQAMLPSVSLLFPRQEVQEVIDRQDVKQGKMVLGFTTETKATDADYPALVMANGIFGAFSHSRLFMTVREQASLAYYVYSRLDAAKGFMLVQAGVELGDREKAQEIILRELSTLQAGDFSQEDMERSLRAYENGILSGLDSPSQMIMTDLELRLEGRNAPPNERIARLRAVTKDQIVYAFQKLKPHTFYYLAGKEGL